MDITYTHTLEGIDWDVLAALFTEAGLGTPHPDDLQIAYARSAISRFAWCDGHLVGAVRAMSDGVYHAQLCDTVVAPAYQGQGIGHRLVEDVLDALHGQKVLLTSSFGTEGFYRKRGFRTHKTALARNYGPWWYVDDPPQECQDD